MGILIVTALSTAAIVGATFVLQSLTHAVIPLSMQLTGIVIAGVGTIHMAGGTTAFLQSFAASSVLGPIAGIIGVTSLGIFCFRKIFFGF